MEETISLSEIIQTLKRRLKMIIVITLAAVALAAVVSYFILTPTYSASTQILVNQSGEQGQEQVYTTADISTNVDLINTYNVIITSPRIIEPALEELNLDRSVGAIRGQITVNAEGESQVVTIGVEDENPATAVQIANTLATVFQEDIVEIMSVDNVSILSAAELSDNPTPVNPNPTFNMAIAFIVGLMLALGLSFLLEFLDKTVKTEEDVEQKLGIPVLASISTMNSDKLSDASLSHTNQNEGRETYGA